MPGIGVILNPHSKKYKKRPKKIERMGFIVGDKASLRKTTNLTELRQEVEEFKQRDIDILAISGGDGTNHCTLTSLVDVYGEKPLPKIAFLRGGTLNTVAATMGVSGFSERLLSNLILKYHEEIPFKMRQVRLMKINNEYGFIFGMGVIYNFMNAYYKSGELSPMVAAKTLGHAIASAIMNRKFASHMFDRFDASVSVDGKKWPYANYNAIYTGSINQLGLNFKTYYLVDRFPNKFHINAFSLPPRNVLAYVPKMYRGKPCGSPNFLETAASHAVIDLEHPLPFTIDGDMKPPEKKFEVSMGPELIVVVK